MLIRTLTNLRASLAGTLLTTGMAAGACCCLLALPACGAWDAATAMFFLASAVYAVSCVLAGMDIKDGKGLVKPRGEQTPTVIQ
jgi:hypothetical protein